MLFYLLKRIFLFLPTLLGIILITFFLIQFMPGGPVEQAIAKRNGSNLSGETSASRASGPDFKNKIDSAQILYLQKLYGFDKPWYERLANWIYRLFTFQFGESYFHHKNVSALIFEKLPVSMSLGIITFLLSYLISIPLGIYKAVRNGSAFDLVSSIIVFIGYSVPGFVLGVLLIVLFAGGSFYDFFPLRGLVSDNFSTLGFCAKIIDYVHHLILPITCMMIGSFAVITNLTKNIFLEEIKRQYVTVAFAKGLSEKKVLLKHVFRNALIPLVTGFASGFLAMFFGSSLLIETLFSLDGLGLLSYQAVLHRDYPVVMANLFIFSILYVAGNLLSDILYVLIDPRIKFDDSW